MNEVNSTKESSLSVLWVEDEPAFFTEIKEDICNQIDISFDFASTAAFALKKLTQKKYDVIIIDIYIPVGEADFGSSELKEMLKDHDGRSGIAFLKILNNDAFSKLAKVNNFPNTTIIVCSAYTTEALVRDREILDSENLILIPKSDIYYSSNILLDVFRKIIDNQQTNDTIIDSRSVVTQRKEEQVNSKVIYFPNMFSRLLHSYHKIWLGLHIAIKGTIDFFRTGSFSWYIRCFTRTY